MTNAKSTHIIDKHHLKGNIHIVGVGATGSQVAERLIRLNLSDKMIVYDFDEVESGNLNNQAYLQKHVGMKKVEAIKDLSLLIDPDSRIKIYDKKVETLKHADQDIILILTDNYTARVSILSSLRGNPLVLTGGISSIGGGVEIVRGTENYSKLLKEYEAIGDAPSEPDPNDLTPCGSPISIYHRIGVISSFFCEAIVKYHDDESPIFETLNLDIPNNILIIDNSLT